MLQHVKVKMLLLFISYFMGCLQTVHLGKDDALVFLVCSTRFF